MMAACNRNKDNKLQWEKIAVLFCSRYRLYLESEKLPGPIVNCNTDGFPESRRTTTCQSDREQWSMSFLLDAVISMVLHDNMIERATKRGSDHQLMLIKCVIDELKEAKPEQFRELVSQVGVERGREQTQSIDMGLVNRKKRRSLTQCDLVAPWDTMENLQKYLLSDTDCLLLSHIAAGLCSHPALESRGFNMQIVLQEALRNAVTVISDGENSIYEEVPLPGAQLTGVPESHTLPCVSTQQPSAVLPVSTHRDHPSLQRFQHKVISELPAIHIPVVLPPLTHTPPGSKDRDGMSRKTTPSSARESPTSGLARLCGHEAASTTASSGHSSGLGSRALEKVTPTGLALLEARAAVAAHARDQAGKSHQMVVTPTSVTKVSPVCGADDVDSRSRPSSLERRLAALGPVALPRIAETSLAAVWPENCLDSLSFPASHPPPLHTIRGALPAVEQCPKHQLLEPLTVSGSLNTAGAVDMRLPGHGGHSLLARRCRGEDSSTEEEDGETSLDGDLVTEQLPENCQSYVHAGGDVAGCALGPPRAVRGRAFETVAPEAIYSPVIAATRKTTSKAGDSAQSSQPDVTRDAVLDHFAYDVVDQPLQESEPIISATASDCVEDDSSSVHTCCSESTGGQSLSTVETPSPSRPVRSNNFFTDYRT